MKKFTLLVFLLPLIVFSQGLKTDTEMTTQANVIRNETVQYANTKGRIADMHQSLIDSKVNLSQFAKVSATGTDTYLASISPAISSYPIGFSAWVSFANTNTGAATINFNSIGAKSIKKNVSANLAASDILVGKYYFLIYDGTNFQISLDESGGFTNPMTTNGDIIYGGIGGLPTRLASNSNGKVLTIASAIPSWQDSKFPPDGDYGDIDIQSSGTVLQIDNNVVTYAKMQNASGQRLIGRYAASLGTPQEISLGSGLTLNSSTGVLTSIPSISAGTRLLGRYSASSGDAQEIVVGSGLNLSVGGTLTATGGISGLTANQLTFATSSTTIGGDPMFRVNTASDFLEVYSSSSNRSELGKDHATWQSTSTEKVSINTLGGGSLSLSSASGSLSLSGNLLDNTVNADMVYRNTGSNSHIFRNNSTELVRITSSKNLGLNASTFGTSAVGVLAIGNGTAPTTSPANMIQLYVTSAELRVRDGAGNITLLSPHNFSLIPNGASEPGAFAHWSEYETEHGREQMNIDMLRMARMVEELWNEVKGLREQLVYKKSIE